MRPPQPTKPTLMRSFAPITRPFAIAGAWRAASRLSPAATVPATATAPAPTRLMKSRRVVSFCFVMVSPSLRTAPPDALEPGPAAFRAIWDRKYHL